MLRRNRGKKLLILTLAGVAITALLLLATSISQLQFEPGKRFSLDRGEPPGGGPRLKLNLDLLWQALIWGFFALAPLSIIAAIIWPDYFMKTLIRAVALVLFLVLLVLTIRALKDFIEQLLAALQRLGHQGVAPSKPPGGEGFSLSPTQAPGWAVFTFLLGGLALLTLLGWGLRRLWLRGRTRGSLGAISALAGSAAEDLEAGGDLKNVVLQCYREMSHFLSEQQEIPLRKSMTAREFERQLRRAGVQDEHVAQLSRLFEEVRYGHRESGKREEREALDCLRAVERAYAEKAIA